MAIDYAAILIKVNEANIQSTAVADISIILTQETLHDVALSASQITALKAKLLVAAQSLEAIAGEIEALAQGK